MTIRPKQINTFTFGSPLPYQDLLSGMENWQRKRGKPW